MTPLEHLKLAVFAAKRGFSLSFDGINDVVVVGVVPALAFERTDVFSVAAWIRLTSAGFEPIIGNLNPASGYQGWEVAVFQGRVRFELLNANLSNGLIIVSDTLVNDGVWHHVVATYSGGSDPSDVEIYVDGTMVSKTTVQNNLTASTVPSTGILIGGRLASQEDYAGKIHEVAVYDAVLDASDVTAIHNSGKRADLTVVGPTGSLVGDWKRAPGDGISYPTFPDLSGAGNHGTMTNMAPDDIIHDSPP